MISPLLERHVPFKSSQFGTRGATKLDTIENF